MAWRIDRFNNLGRKFPVKNDYTGRVKLFDMKPIATSYAKLSCFDHYTVEHTDG